MLSHHTTLLQDPRCKFVQSIILYQILTCSNCKTLISAQIVKLCQLHLQFFAGSCNSASNSAKVDGAAKFLSSGFKSLLEIKRSQPKQPELVLLNIQFIDQLLVPSLRSHIPHMITDTHPSICRCNTTHNTKKPTDNSQQRRITSNQNLTSSRYY